MNPLLYICLVCCCLFHGGVSQNSKISCPSTFFEKGSSILQLTIVNSTFSVCAIKPTTVTCRWAPKDGLESVICRGSVTSCEKDATSPRCPCVEENGQGFKYSFDFWMLRNEEQGSIYCDLDCTVLSGPKATVDSSEQCSNITFVSKCDNNGPCVRGTCRINENDDAVCDCTGTAYDGTSCEHLNLFVKVLIPVVTYLLFVFLSPVIGIIVMITTYESVRVFDVMTSENLAKFVEYLNSPSCQAELSKDNKGTVGLNGSVSVKVCGQGIVEKENTHSDNKPPRILVSGKLIWYFNLNTLADKIERRFLTEMKLPEPKIDYHEGNPMSQPKYTGEGNRQPKKSKSNKAIPLSSVGRSSPPSEASGDEKTHMIPATRERALPVPTNQHELTSIGIGKSASPRLDPLTPDHSKMPSVERNSGAFPRKLPSPGQPPLDPIPSGKKS